MRRLSRAVTEDSSAEVAAAGDSDMTVVAGLADVTDAAGSRDIRGSAVRTVAVVVFQVPGADVAAPPIE